MSESILSTFVKRKYTLGKGGPYGHTEEGKLKVYRPGDEIYLTDEQAAQRSLQGRLTLVDQKAVMFTEKAPAVSAPTPATSASVAAPAKQLAAVEIDDEALVAVAEELSDDDANVTTKRTKITDWSFVPKTLTETLVSLIDDLDDIDDLKALQAAEKTRKNDGGRARVRQAVTARTRQLNMAKARAAREKGLAKKRAEKAAGEGDKEETGTE